MKKMKFIMEIKILMKKILNYLLDNKEIKFNKDSNEKNNKFFIDDKEINCYINNLKKGIYIIIMKIEEKITCEYMFYECNKIIEIEFINFDTKNVTNMKEMFSNCSGLKILNLNNFDSKNVSTMRCMFYECSG